MSEALLFWMYCMDTSPGVAPFKSSVVYSGTKIEFPPTVLESQLNTEVSLPCRIMLKCGPLGNPLLLVMTSTGLPAIAGVLMNTTKNRNTNPLIIVFFISCPPSFSEFSEEVLSKQHATSN